MEHFTTKYPKAVRTAINDTLASIGKMEKAIFKQIAKVLPGAEQSDDTCAYCNAELGMEPTADVRFKWKGHVLRIRVLKDTSYVSIPGELEYDLHSLSELPEVAEKAIRKTDSGADTSETGKKYELTDDTIEVEGHTLHRIRALRDITDPMYPDWNVKKGDLGGYVESEENLSHEGTAWVGDEAVVYDDTHVSDDAYVYGNASVYGNARVYDHARVFGDAWVYGNAEVYDSAWVCENAKVSGDAKVYGEARVYGHARVYDVAQVFGDAKVYNDELWGTAKVHGDGNDDEGEMIATPMTDTVEPSVKDRVTILEGNVIQLTSDIKKLSKRLDGVVKELAAIKKPKKKSTKKSNKKSKK